MPISEHIAIVGGGLAGLSLAYHLGRAGKLEGRKVTIYDPERKAGHDRTWCFWQRERGIFEELVYRRWERVIVADEERYLECELAPYAYKMIRSTEFYAHVNAYLDGRAEVNWVHASVEEVISTTDGVGVIVGGVAHNYDYAFDSRPRPVDFRETEHPYLDQHFRGWFIETKGEVFDPEVASLMDFRTPQLGECRFFYVLPFDRRRAMVEFTAFSNNHLSEAEYAAAIEAYLARFWTNDYRVEHREGGNIPMTTHPLPRRNGNHIYIGLGGGAARPSTGYTFLGLQRYLAKLVERFPDLDRLPANWPLRHVKYDATILRILQEGRLRGDRIFVDLFEKNPTPRLLAFLNGESSLPQDLGVMATTDITTFGKTFFSEL